MFTNFNHAEDAEVNQEELLRRSSGQAGQARYEQYFAHSSFGDGESITTMSHATAPDPDQQAGNNARVGSVYSYNSTRDVSRFVRELHGRTFNNLNDSYLLPADEPEWHRLDKQHSALVLGFGGLYPCLEIIDAVLAPTDDGEPKRILDLGCGTGSWVIEMATQFPNAIVKGIDVAPPPVDAGNIPQNIQFEIYDINSGLQHCFGEYDLVHSRCALSGIKDFRKTLLEMQQCLKPGGVLLIIGGDIELEDERDHKAKMIRLDGDEDVSSLSDHGSWMQRMAWEATRAATIAGSDRETAIELTERGLWEQPMMDPNTAVNGGVYLPIGPWAHSSDSEEDQILKYTGLLMQQVFLNLHKAYHPMLLRHGITQETLNEWSSHAEEEVKTMNPNLWVRFRFCWARRRAGENLPAPDLPVVALPAASSSSDGNLTHPLSEATGSRRYRAFATYHSLEEALIARQRRRESVGVWPEAAVRKAWRLKQQELGSVSSSG